MYQVGCIFARLPLLPLKFIAVFLGTITINFLSHFYLLTIYEHPSITCHVTTVVERSLLTHWLHRGGSFLGSSELSSKTLYMPIPGSCPFAWVLASPSFLWSTYISSAISNIFKQCLGNAYILRPWKMLLQFKPVIHKNFFKFRRIYLIISIGHIL